METSKLMGLLKNPHEGMKSLNSASAVLCRCTAADKKEKIMVTQFNTIMILKAAAATECYSVRDNNVTGT